MNALQTFLAMGGYAAYVWPAYALFFIVLIADTVAPRL
ncbi:MAG: heme exporter protein CcmD, partial [Rhodanobacter sp.]